jgi:hypothetical protein
MSPELSLNPTPHNHDYQTFGLDVQLVVRPLANDRRHIVSSLGADDDDQLLEFTRFATISLHCNLKNVPLHKNMDLSCI